MMGRRHRHVVVAGISFIVAACGTTESAGPVTDLLREVDTVGGVPLVRSSGTAPAWSAPIHVSVGSEGQPGEPAPDEFGQVASVTPDRSGNLWVADALNSEIRVFDPEGGFLQRVGRDGQGPGEFVSIYSIAWVGRHLLVLDFGNGRVGVLDSAGTWVGQRPAPGRITGSPSGLRFYPVSDSISYQWSVSVVDRRMDIVWVEHDERGITNEWPRLSMEPPVPQNVICNRSDGAISFFEVPFGGRVLQHPAGGGNTWVAWSADYRIALVTPDGDTLKIVERVREPLPLSDAEWDEGTAEFREFREEWPGADCTPTRPDRPSAKAALRSLLMDADGRLWAEVYTASGTAWEVFDREGRLQGRLNGFDYDDRVAVAMRYGFLSWVSRDSLGVQRAHMARIQSGPPS